jgi:hypothetical protein
LFIREDVVADRDYSTLGALFSGLEHLVDLTISGNDLVPFLRCAAFAPNLQRLGFSHDGGIDAPTLSGLSSTIVEFRSLTLLSTGYFRVESLTREILGVFYDAVVEHPTLQRLSMPHTLLFDDTQTDCLCEFLRRNRRITEFLVSEFSDDFPPEVYHRMLKALAADRVLRTTSMQLITGPRTWPDESMTPVRALFAYNYTLRELTGELNGAVDFAKKCCALHEKLVPLVDATVAQLGDGNDCRAGDFEVFPNEMVCAIAALLDVRAFYEFACASRRTRACAFSSWTCHKRTDCNDVRALFLEIARDNTCLLIP